jgi:hypothetical protein
MIFQSEQVVITMQVIRSFFMYFRIAACVLYKSVLLYSGSGARTGLEKGSESGNFSCNS